MSKAEKKIKKAPKPFRKKLNQKKWNKKIIRNIHIPADRKWLEERFEPVDNRMVLKKDLPKKDLKKLKVLGKAIKKNKGTVTRWKAAILLTIAAAVAVFTIFFKNMLLERGIETGLETLFEAYSDAREPKISLFRGSFTMDGLTVQNKDRPSRNLFEFGNTAFAVNMGQLSRNRYHIDEITLQGLKFNSSRDSDELPESSVSESGESGDSLIDLEALGSDAAAEIESLIEEQIDNLQTLKYLENANEELSTMTDRWEELFDESAEKVKESAEQVKALTDQGTPSISSVQEAAEAAAEYKSAYDSLESTKSELEDLNSRFKEETQQFQSIKSEVSTLIDEDVEYLSSLIELPGIGDLKNIVSDKIKKILMEQFSDYYAMAEPFLPYLEKLRDRQATEEKKKKISRLQGSYIPLESATIPRFLISRINLDGGDGSSGTFEGLIEGISSEPDKLDQPITLDANWIKDTSTVALDGFLDMREDAEEMFLLNFSSPGGSAELNDGMSALGIESARADLTYSGTGMSNPDGEGVLVSLDMNFNNAEFEMPDDPDMIATLISDTLEDLQSFLVSAEILMDGKGIQSIAVSTDIDRVLQDRLGDLIDELPSQGADALESYIRNMISDDLLTSEKLASSLDALGIESLDQINSMEELQAKVDELKNQAEDRGDAILNEAEEKARAEAEAAKAEAEAKAQAEADAAKAEAEEKLKEEASKIKLPGF